MVFKTFLEPVPELKWELLSWILKRTDKPLIPDAKHSGNNFLKFIGTDIWSRRQRSEVATHSLD